MKPTEKATRFSVTLSENERNSLTVPDVRAEGKISLFNIIEAGGGYLHTADNEYLKIEGNILNLTNLLPDFRLTVPIPFTKATIEIFDLKEVRSFNLFTIQKGSIDALSNTVITGLPLLRSVSFDTFLNDDLVFIQPAFYLWISLFPIWFIPQYERTNKLVTSYEAGIEFGALLGYFLNRNKNNEISKLTKSEFRQYYDDLTSGLHYPGFPDPGGRSMLSTVLMFRHTFYDPYYSLTDKSRSIFIGIVQGGGVFVFNEKKYKKAIEDAGETYDPFIKKIVMMNNMEMGITYDLENQNFSVDFVVNMRVGKVLTPSNKE